MTRSALRSHAVPQPPRLPHAGVRRTLHGGGGVAKAAADALRPLLAIGLGIGAVTAIVALISELG